MTQRVFEGMPWDALLEHLDAIFAAGDSVSAFTRWGADVDQVWVKRRGADTPAPELFGARAATVERHPIIELDPANCTAQLGRPGPWWDRLPHFRLDSRPSAGEELQSEYFVGRADAPRRDRGGPRARRARCARCCSSASCGRSPRTTSG